MVRKFDFLVIGSGIAGIVSAVIAGTTVSAVVLPATVRIESASVSGVSELTA